MLMLDFLITQNCNYRCEYCSQSKKFVEGALQDADDEVISALLGFLKKQNEPFEVTISGGEPFYHKKFFYLVEEIVKMGGNISVVSNFSFPFSEYKRLKDVAGEKLTGVFVSLHLSQIKNLDNFLKKALEFNKIKGNTNFTVGAVLSNENCETLKNAAVYLEENGVKFELQHMRIKNLFVKYKKNAENFIKNFPVSKIKEKNRTFGKICTAGKNFAVIYQNGEAYRCYSSRFNKIHSMGNIKNKSFKMYKNELPCLNKNCTCPKPIILNLMNLNSSKPFLATLLGIYNLFYLPYFAIKKFNIIKTKLKQAKSLKHKAK